MKYRRRQIKVSEQVRQVVSIYFSILNDSKLGFLSITKVICNSDLSEAKVYWNVYQAEENAENVAKQLPTHIKKLRKEIAMKLKLRIVPKIKFFYDDTLDTINEVNKLFEKLETEGTKD